MRNTEDKVTCQNTHRDADSKILTMGNSIGQITSLFIKIKKKKEMGEKTYRFKQE